MNYSFAVSLILSGILEGVSQYIEKLDAYINTSKPIKGKLMKYIKYPTGFV